MPASRAPLRVLFVDDGGVLNDNERRAPEWRRLIGEFFAPRLGGTPEAWEAANGPVIEDWWRRWLAYAPTAVSGGLGVLERRGSSLADRDVRRRRGGGRRR